jgi:TfoX/Sxy family transcriptional regulator of competence genes
MPYDERLASRVRTALAGRDHITEKKMFGGLAFLQRGHMFVGISGDKLMARVGKDHHADALARAHVVPMDFTGKPMAGYVYVLADGLKADKDLRFWLDRCHTFAAALPPK